MTDSITKIWRGFLLDNAKTIESMQSHAAIIHREVNQKYDSLPYSFHTNMVSSLFMQYGSVCFCHYATEKARCEMDKKGLAAIFGSIFHDTIEDCRLTYNDVLKIAGGYMPSEQAKIAADIVYALTNEKGKTRSERANDKYYEGIRNTDFAPCIKLCDRYANCLFANSMGTSMAKAYRREMKEFLDKIRVDENCMVSERFLPSMLYDACLTFPFSDCVNDDNV